MTSKLRSMLSQESNASDSCVLMEYVLNALPEPIALVDTDGIVVFLNKAYQRFLNITNERAIGRHVTEVIDNTRLHIVCSGGEPEIDFLQNIRGKEAVVQRIPIIINGEVLGAIGKVSFRSVDEIKALVRRLKLFERNADTYEQTTAMYNFRDIIGTSQKISLIKAMAEKAARADSSILILGETGVGKELFSHAIHNSSNRRAGPFVSINCAAIPHELLESELFGYEGGAFTGARRKGKVGKFELADGGTIFLDEIGDMSPSMQAKLLRILQDKCLEKIGGVHKKSVDVRVIAATNQDLEKKVKRGEFRADLFYRLNTIILRIPPLRERLEDIPLLVESALKQANASQNTNKRLTPEAMELLTTYPWPGNVRELLNVIERLIFLVDSEIIKPKHVKKVLLGFTDDTGDNANINVLQDSLNTTEKEAIQRALDISKGNKIKAAKILGIHRTTLYKKIRKYNLM